MARLTLRQHDAYARSHLHDVVAALAPKAKGGNRQSGISFDHHAKIVMFFTGTGSRDHPYHDGWHRNVFWYSGQGLSGDMEWTAYNTALLTHADRGYELHGFHGPQPDGTYVYLGEFRCAGSLTDHVPGVDGRVREAFMFLLVPQGPVVHGPGIVAARYLTPEMQERAAQVMTAFSAGERPTGLTSPTPSRHHVARRPVRPPLPPEFTGPSDGTAWQTVRREQGRLRDYLLSLGEASVCSVCGRRLPQSLLVAAHLKPRYQCSEQERRDVNVVRLMCTLGCDALYEQGYIQVVNGEVIVGRQTDLPDLSEGVAAVVGRRVTSWEASEPYFAWHRQQLTGEHGQPHQPL